MCQRRWSPGRPPLRAEPIARIRAIRSETKAGQRLRVFVIRALAESRAFFRGGVASRRAPVRRQWLHRGARRTRDSRYAAPVRPIGPSHGDRRRVHRPGVSRPILRAVALERRGVLPLAFAPGRLAAAARSWTMAAAAPRAARGAFMDALFLRDPAGLVARTPELGRLAERSPALRKAIEAGRPLDAYRALFWGQRRRHFGDLGDVAEALLGHRRLFFKPLTSAPKMFTYNGCGTSLYGRADVDAADHTYVSTLYFVVFFIPVFPLGSYLVRDAASNRRAWNFLAKVPLSTATHVWQRAWALAIAGGLCVAGASAVEGFGHNTVYAVNGLPHAVEVAISGAPPVTVPAGGHASVRTTVGHHTVTTTDHGRTIESGKLSVPRGSAMAVWNVLGAAPLFVAEVQYGAEHAAGPPSSPPEPAVFCDQTAMEMSSIDYAFVDAPSSILDAERKLRRDPTSHGGRRGRPRGVRAVPGRAQRVRTGRAARDARGARARPGRGRSRLGLRARLCLGSRAGGRGLCQRADRARRRRPGTPPLSGRPPRQR